MAVMKGLGLAGLLVAAVVAWRELPRLLQPLGPTPQRAPAIQFDNGTVRQQPLPSSAPGLRSAHQAPDALRKCVRGASVTYTNVPCPPGHQSQPVRDDRMTVVPGAVGAKAPSPVAPPGSPPGPGRRGVQQALDLSDTALRREQAQQGAFEQATR